MHPNTIKIKLLANHKKARMDVKYFNFNNLDGTATKQSGRGVRPVVVPPFKTSRTSTVGEPSRPIRSVMACLTIKIRSFAAPIMVGGRLAKA